MADGVIQLTDAHSEELRELLNQQPAHNVFLRSRTSEGVAAVGHPILGYISDGSLVSALSVGPNLVPASATIAAISSFASYLAQMPRSCASIVGQRSEVAQLWSQLSPHWGPARLVRDRQPYLVLSDRLQIEVEGIRRMRSDDLDSYVVASAAMFAGEVEVDLRSINPTAYRQRVHDSLRRGMSFGLIDEAGITRFKTDVGCLTRDYCQIQGVWLHPDWRGRGLAVQYLGAAITLIQKDFDVDVCLYVNDFNRPALATYAALGFQQTTEFSTVFF